MLFQAKQSKKQPLIYDKTSEMCLYNSLWNSMFSYIISNMLCSTDGRFCINFPSNSISNTQSSIRNSQTDKNSPQTLCNVAEHCSCAAPSWESNPAHFSWITAQFMEHGDYSFGCHRWGYFTILHCILCISWIHNGVKHISRKHSPSVWALTNNSDGKP